MDSALETGNLLIDVRRYGKNDWGSDPPSLPYKSHKTLNLTSMDNNIVGLPESKWIDASSSRSPNASLTNSPPDSGNVKEAKQVNGIKDEVDTKQKGSTDSSAPEMPVPSINVSTRWSWDPEEERKRQEKWHQEQEKMLQEKYKREQERLKEEWEQAQQEAEKGRSFDQEPEILPFNTSRSMTSHSPFSYLRTEGSEDLLSSEDNFQVNERRQEEERERKKEEEEERFNYLEAQRRQAAEEERRRQAAEIERRRQAAEEERLHQAAEEERRRQAAEEERRHQQEIERKRQEENRRQKEEEERRLREEEWKRKKQEEEEEQRLKLQSEQTQRPFISSSYSRLSRTLDESDYSSYSSSKYRDAPDSSAYQGNGSHYEYETSSSMSGSQKEGPAEMKRQQIIKEMRKKAPLNTDNSWIRQRSSSVTKDTSSLPDYMRRGESLDNLDSGLNSWRQPSLVNHSSSYNSLSSSQDFSQPSQVVSTSNRTYLRNPSPSLPLVSSGSVKSASLSQTSVASSGLPQNQSSSQTSVQQRNKSVSGKKLCSYCNNSLGKGAAMIIESLGLCFHLHCFKCVACETDLGGSHSGAEVRIRNNDLYCNSCYIKFKSGHPTSM